MHASENDSFPGKFSLGVKCISFVVRFLIAKLKTTRGLANFTVNAITAADADAIFIFLVNISTETFAQIELTSGNRRALKCGFIGEETKTNLF